MKRRYKNNVLGITLEVGAETCPGSADKTLYKVEHMVRAR